MKWRLFIQIVILLVLAGVVFYSNFPKYYFLPNSRVQANMINGDIRFYDAENSTWNYIE